MLSEYAQIKSLKKDLRIVRDNLIANISSSNSPKIDKNIGDSYELINKHLIYNGVLTRIKE